ncbi:MAG: PD-(D/E)XK nuclease family protein, partial [Candidatus Heimdallarchaeota archaeon]
MPFHKISQRRLEEELMAKKFTVSKSLLEKYFGGCAFRGKLYKEWNLKVEYMPKPLRDGIEAHDLIERSLSGEALYDPKTLEPLGSARGIDIAERAHNWAEKNGYEVLDTEVKHLAPLTEDIQLFGVIDLLALDRDGIPVCIDWKTSAKQWTATKIEDGELVVIGATGWQGPIYLTPPAKNDILNPEEWPDKMLYVVIPKTGSVGEFPYYKNEVDDQALLRACQAV